MDSNFKHRKLYAKKLGVSDRVITEWMFRKWTKGQHYVVIGKQTLINIPEVDKWLISQKESNNTVQASVSDGQSG